VVVFAVWEPILPTDWSAPGTSALNRLNDRRVRQFWDPAHMVADVLKKAEEAGRLHPDCCRRNGFLWDLIAAYGHSAKWGDTLPEPILLNGTMVQTADALESIVTKAK
jgi:hypothetical protein